MQFFGIRYEYFLNFRKRLGTVSVFPVYTDIEIITKFRKRTSGINNIPAKILRYIPKIPMLYRALANTSLCAKKRKIYAISGKAD